MTYSLSILLTLALAIVDSEAKQCREDSRSYSGLELFVLPIGTTLAR